MTSGDLFAHRLDALSRRVLGGPVAGLMRLTGGASLELWSFDVNGVGHVLRRAPGARRFAEMATIGLETEAQVIGAVGACGVPVPRILYVLTPADGLADGFVASREPGEALGRRVVGDPVYAPLRETLAAECGRVLAAIHAAPVDLLPSLPCRSPRESLERLATQLTCYDKPRPVFELAILHLARNCPDAVVPRLVHGDFRTGNFLVTPDRFVAVLDWEGAHLGDPAEDLGWLCMPIWAFGRLDRAVGGFGRREDLHAAYARAGGEVDQARLRWWELYGMLRWGLTCMAMAAAFAQGDRGIERAAVGRRAFEAELELLIALGAER